MSRGLRFLKTGVIAAVFSCVVITTFFFWKIPLNNAALWRMGRAVSAHAQRFDSDLIAKRSYIGSRYIDAAECTFAAGEIRRTLHSKEEVEAAYAHTGYAKKSLWYVSVQGLVIDEHTIFPEGEPPLQWVDEFRSRALSEQGTYYLLYAYEPGHVAFGDWRCLERDL